MSTIVTDGFESGDDTLVVSILKKWRGGPLSDELFTVLAGMLPHPGVATVILRKKVDLEIFLVSRPSKDIVWPGMLNLPGKQFRAADYHRPDNNPLNGPLERIQEDEIKTRFDGEPKFAGVSLHSDSRGPQVVLVYLILLKPDSEFSPKGVWVDIGKLKNMENFIQSELKSIKVALDFLNSAS